MYRNIVCLYIGILSLFACSDKNLVYTDVVPLEIGSTSDAVTKELTDEFTDFHLMRLDNSEKALLSWVKKVCVTDRGLYILDYKNPAQILHFDKDGKFICKIGDYGRKKSEYISIYNFSTNNVGDTIAILDSRRILLFNDKGEHIKTETLNEHTDDILLTKRGMITSDYHHENSHLLTLYNSADIVGKYIDLEKRNIRGTSPSQNFLQQCGEKICYYDYFSSHFYVMDAKKHETLKCYELRSDKILNEVAIENGNDRSKYTYVNNYVIDDSTIIGNIHIDRVNYDFCINMRTDDFSLVKLEGSHYFFDSYSDGYYYKILSPSYILDILQKSYNSKARKIFSEALKPYIGKVSEKDNYYVLRMRRK